MPELPEVETVRRQLDKVLPFTIKSVEYSPVADSIVKTKEFSPRGKTIKSFDRKGKALVIVLDDESVIISHFGMSGGWRISETKVTEKHTHIQFKSQSLYLAYVDPRRFGKLHYLTKKNYEKKLKTFGIDITSPEFTPEYIYNVLRKYPNRQIKPFLLDQKFFAGVGNYIACEICARAGIRPTRRCGKISKRECQKIKEATDSVLNQAIKRQGLTFSGGYSDTTGSGGQGLQDLVVFYQKLCGLCERAAVKKIVLAQRGTYYCPECQN